MIFCVDFNSKDMIDIEEQSYGIFDTNMALFKVTTDAAGKTNANHRAALQGPRFGRVFWYVMCLCILAVYSTAAFFYWVAIRISYPYEFDYGEGIVLWQAQHVSHLAIAYAPITHYPFIVFHYPPLYHLTSLVLSKVTGNLLLAGRLVSSLSSLGICITLSWVVYRSVPARASRLAAVCGAILAAAFPCGLDVMKWTPLMRVDMLGLWLSFVGMAVFVLARNTAQRYFAFVLLVAAIYTKQSLVAGAGACLLVAGIINLRQAIKMFVFTASLGGAILAAFALSTHGEVIKHIFAYNVNRFSILTAIIYLVTDTESPILLMALAVAAAIISIRDTARAFWQHGADTMRARLSGSPYRLAALTFTAHFTLSALVSLTSGKSGSNFNYFLELNLSTCVLASLFIVRLVWNCRTGRISSAYVLTYLLPILILGHQFYAATRLLMHIPVMRGVMAQKARNSEALELILRNSPEPVMSEDMTLLYKAGKQVPFEPAIVTELAARHAWDEAPLVSMIRNRAFSVMVISDLGFYSPEVWRSIVENYRPAGTYAEFQGNYTLYIPSRQIR